MNDYRLEIRIKNARLHDAIHAKFKSVKEFCDDNGLQYTSVCALLRMELEARQPSTGNWREVTQKVCDALGEFPDDLFNERQQFGKQLEKFRAIHVSEHAIKWLSASDSDPALMANDESQKAIVSSAISQLPERMQRVLKLHIYEDKTIEETGVSLGIGRERARQILLDSFRKLRRSLDRNDFDGIEDTDSLEEMAKRRRYANFPRWKASEEALMAIGA
jgi:RNA polymerase sigma factor (sigma-70 family)